MLTNYYIQVAIGVQNDRFLLCASFEYITSIEIDREICVFLKRDTTNIQAAMPHPFAASGGPTLLQEPDDPMNGQQGGQPKSL